MAGAVRPSAPRLLQDAEKSARTFPELDGVRYSVPGDRATLEADGRLVLLGRDSVTINSGGEKIFAEEVEHALKHHPAVYDAVVVPTPHERWGQHARPRTQSSDSRLPERAGSVWERVDRVVVFQQLRDSHGDLPEAR